MRLRTIIAIGAGLAVLTPCSLPVAADTLWLKDGTTISNCFIRDESVRLVVWEKLADVGTPNYKIVPRSLVKLTENGWYKIERDEASDAHPNLPDLGISHIEINPKLESVHGHVDYDQWGRPVLRGKGLPDLGERAYMHPEEVVKDVKLKYSPGEEMTMTAHVRNVGFVTAKPFDYVWLIDGNQIGKGKCKKSLKELEETTFAQKWNWQDGMHSVTFKVLPDEPEIATINNELTDPIWGWGFTFVINPGRIAWWHQRRNSFGTFSFEDYYRWQIDIMNLIMENSKFPSAPDGIKARVRIDRIIWTQDLEQGGKETTDSTGLQPQQGVWYWGDSPDEKAGKWGPFPKTAGKDTEWSLIHELGHQLGLVDWYGLDCDQTGEKDPNHMWPDNGEPVYHFMTHPDTMMHWHGPDIFSEVDAGYLNMSWDKPRGHFGDHYFAIPAENFIRVVDVNGLPVIGAKVEMYQRGAKVDPNGQPSEDQGVKYFPVIEDGDFSNAISTSPVIVGTTDEDGMMKLPNRPVKEVRTLNGYERKPNPFGNINVVGNRGLMLVKITKFDKPTFFWLEAYNFNVAWFRGQKDKFTTVFKTPYRSTSSPLAPTDVKFEQIDPNHVKVTWQAPKMIREQQYLDRVIGYRVYRRVGPMGLDDRPWFPVATLGPDATEFTVDLTQKPEDVYWYSMTNRFAVSSLGELSMESELVEAPMGTK
jgi:hypothetical protein